MPGLSGTYILLGLGQTGKLPQVGQASLPRKPWNPLEGGQTGTHRDKVGASKIPNDSCGCADAHVADDGEKPPAKKRTGKGQSLGCLSAGQKDSGDTPSSVRVCEYCAMSAS